jgi:3-oxoacyl-[acyl-carrier protein] reductase
MGALFQDRAILVTGSTRGIGLAIARYLLERGAVVGIQGRTDEAVARACSVLAPYTGQCRPLTADFGRPESAAELVRTFAAQTGRLDGLVNNAGGGKAVAFRGLTPASWRATFALNLESAVWATREAYCLMRPQGAGSIVNIASLAAHGPGKWMGADYAAAKAGLVSLTQSLAFEAARFNIRVNAVSPGFVETDLTAVLTPEMRAGLNIPLGRLARPEEMAGPVAFLLSEHSAYITGEVLHVDGGLWMKG